MGGEDVLLRPTAALDEGEWSTSSPGRFSHQEKLQYPLNRKLGHPQSQYETFGEIGDLFPLSEFEPLTV